VTWGPRTPCFSRGGGGTAPAVGRVRAFLQVAARSSVATPQPPRHNATCSCTKGSLFSDGEAPGSQQPALPPSQNAKTEGSGSHPPGTGLCCENLRPTHGPPHAAGAHPPSRGTLPTAPYCIIPVRAVTLEATGALEPSKHAIVFALGLHVRPHAMPKPPPRTHAAAMHAARKREATAGPARAPHAHTQEGRCAQPAPLTLPNTLRAHPPITPLPRTPMSTAPAQPHAPHHPTAHTAE